MDILPKLVSSALLALSIAYPFESSSDQAVSGISESQLVEKMRAGNVDQIIEALDQVKNMLHPQDVLPVVLDVWQRNSKAHPEFPWKSLDTAVVRISIADVLLQAHGNGFIQLHDRGMHNYVLSQASSQDLQSVEIATQDLAYFNSEGDVPLLKFIFKSKNQPISRSAALALVRMCNSQADKTISELINDKSVDEASRNYLNTANLEMSRVKEQVGWCERPKAPTQ